MWSAEGDLVQWDQDITRQTTVLQCKWEHTWNLFYFTLLGVRERKERSETFENEIIQYVNYTDILPMFFL